MGRLGRSLKELLKRLGLDLRRSDQTPAKLEEELCWWVRQSDNDDGCAPYGVKNLAVISVHVFHWRHEDHAPKFRAV